MSENILRKFGLLETIYYIFDDLADDNRLFRITSQIDYYQHLDLMKQSIKKWSAAHPFLNAKVKNIDSEFYFIKTNEESSNELLKNVKFLNVNSTEQQEYDDLVELLLEAENVTKIKTEEKLWRLTFIKQMNQTNEFNFDIILSIHHIATEGRNMFSLILSLLDLFEKSFHNESIDLKPFNVLPSVEDLFIKKNNPNNATTTDVIGFFKPSFIDSEKAKIDSLENTNQKYEKYTDVTITLAENGQDYSSVKELIELAKTNQMKFSFIKLSQEETSKLVRKLKQEKVTMQSFLNVLFSMACRKMYTDLGDETEKNKTIFTLYVASLRQFAEDKSQFGEQNISENMGVFINPLYYMQSDEVTLDSFWSIVRKENENIKLKFENKDQYKSPIYSFDDKNFKPDEFYTDVIVSNVGIVPDRFSPEGLHKIKSAFISLRSHFACRLFCNNLCTLNGSLYWSFSYNSFFVNKHLVDMFLNTSKEYISCLAD